MELCRNRRGVNANLETKFFMSFNFPKIPKNIYQAKLYQCQLPKGTHNHPH
jgi:hypothetical protein